jgi:SAM-dependent methyltransferase
VKAGWRYLKCTRCGLLCSDPLPTRDQIEAHYRAKFQRGNYHTARVYEADYRRIHQSLARVVAPQRGERILDVGCFTGELLQILAADGADVYGLELQTEAVQIANQRLPGRVFQADVNGTSFPQDMYDVITMMGLIEHVTDPRAFVRRAAELLKPRGRLVFQTPDAGSVPARILRSAWPPLAPVEHIHLFSRAALKGLLESEGFTDVTFKCHVKRLPVGYVYAMLANFGGRRWQSLFRPVYTLLGNTALPFYVGEFIATARKA